MAVALAAADAAVARAVQDALDHRPALGAAHALSAFGEHAAGWLAWCAAGAALDVPRRAAWVRAGTAVAGAHAAAVVLKRVVRRPRPAVRVLTRTHSGLSFPSSHAASTTAAVLVLRPLAGPAAPLLPAAGVAMALSRVLLGVHHPTDVLAGAALGAAASSLTRARS